MSTTKFLLCLLTSALLRELTAELVELNQCCSFDNVSNILNDNCGAISNSSESILRIPSYNYEEELQFRLRPNGYPKCSTGVLETYDVDLNNSETFFMTASGVLLQWNNAFYVNHERHHYCIHPLEKNSAVRIVICPARCDDTDHCLRKCCPIGETFKHSDGRVPEECVPTLDIKPRVPTLLGPRRFLMHHDTIRVQSPRIYSGHESIFYNCSSGTIKISSGWPNVNVKRPFNLLGNGTPSYFHSGSRTWKPFEHLRDYCYEHILDSPEKNCNETEVLFMCRTAAAVLKISAVQTDRTLHKITLVIAIMSLLIATVVLALLLERSNLHSWTRLAYVKSNLFFMILFGFTYFEWLNPFSRPKGCTAFAIIFHYAGLLTICWLSVMNFDLWWTFRALKPSGHRSMNGLRFLLYCTFAFGVPASIISMAFIIQLNKPEIKDKKYCLSALEDPKTYDETFGSHLFLYPDYGRIQNRRCTLSSASLPLYWYGPLCFLLMSNLVFFFATSYRLMRYQRRARRASIESTNSSSVQAHIFLKIFIVSGVTWNTEIISWLFADGTWLWVDILHHVQAFALFVIFVCKPEVLKSLQARYPVITKVIPPAGRTTRSATLGSLSTELNTRVNSRKTSVAGSEGEGQVATLRKFESFEMNQPNLPSSPTEPSS